MSAKRKPLVSDIHNWNWSYKGMTPENVTITFKGTTRERRDGASLACATIEGQMREKYPTVRWMHGKNVEPEDGSVTFGPSVQLGKFLRPGDETAPAPEVPEPNKMLAQLGVTNPSAFIPKKDVDGVNFPCCVCVNLEVWSDSDCFAKCAHHPSKK